MPTKTESTRSNTIRLYKTVSHPCSYLPGRIASSVVVDPQQVITKSLYSHLSHAGFRRSGTHLYRPDCAGCKACVSSRVRVNDFKRNRRFRKVWNRNLDLEVAELADPDTDELFALYVRYIEQRHSDGDMYPPDREQYRSFIGEASPTSRFVSFSLEGEVVAVCVIDVLHESLSAVYTFFEPDLSQRSLGSYVILWQIEKARQLGLRWLFLGYWIEGCAKMNYKTQFRPLELFRNGYWEPSE